MPGRRGLSALAAVLLAPVLLLVGGALVTDRDPGAAPEQTAASAQSPQSPVEALQQRLRRLPRDDAAWAALGVAYVEEARRTADPSFYELAGDALDRSLQVRPDGNADALAGQAALANARHDFVAGRDLALQAVAADAYDATARGVLVDSQLELGEYEAGAATLEAMLSLRPGVPSFTRASYLFELRGDTENARAALERALDVATTPAEASFALLHLGELALGAGDVDAAAAHFAEGLRRDPAQVELLAGRARAAAARGDVDAALADYADVVQRLPQPRYLVEYGELLESIGRQDDAAEQYAVAEAAQALFAAAGSVPDVESVLADADHGRADRALAAAEAQYATRRSVQVEDALAWALHASGRSAEALPHALAAQRLGTRNALWDYHRGVIQLAAGQVEEGRASLARALETPAFSVRHAPLAQQALAASAPG